MYNGRRPEMNVQSQAAPPPWAPYGQPRPPFEMDGYINELERLSRIRRLKSAELTHSRRFKLSFRDFRDGLDDYYNYNYDQYQNQNLNLNQYQHPPMGGPPPPSCGCRCCIAQPARPPAEELPSRHPNVPTEPSLLSERRRSARTPTLDDFCYDPFPYGSCSVM